MTSKSAEPPVPLGTILRDTYELVSVLGTGAMGTVFLARHLRLHGKQVAVKVLHGHEQLTPTQYARFRREARISSRINHPNIVTVLDFNDRENGMPFLVMEYLRGESLADRIRRGPISLPEVLSIARQMGAALQAAHDVGIIHRDLKPGNVCLLPADSGAEGPRVKLLDFGISKIVSSQSIKTRDDVLLGTPRYMSPEQATGQNSTVDGRADQFALGSIVYELLCGEPPFVSNTVADILYRVVYATPEPLTKRRPGLPAEVYTAVDRALAKAPGQRFPDVMSFVAHLTGAPPPARRAQPPPPPVGDDTEVDEEDDHKTTLPLAATVQDTGVPARPRSQVPLVATVAVLGVLALVAGGYLLRTSAPAGGGTPVSAPTPPPSPPPQVVAGSTQAPETPAPPPSVPPPPPAAELPKDTPKTDVIATPAPIGKKTPPRPATSEKMPDSVRQALDEAQRALEAGKTSDAIDIIRRSQRIQVTGASFALLTQVYCHAKDLTNVRAPWRKVPKAEQGRVRQYCKRYGIEL